MEILEYESDDGKSPFGAWLDGLAAPAAAKVTTAVERMALGNLADTKSVGQGVLERRIDYGPGYRIYFAKDGDQIVILLGGGTKKRQEDDIQAAHERWADYKKRKKKEGGSHK
jgi:putative addiction module killer protein